ncbi:hypothetical protein C8R43DRAFT_951531 [Mycena crocata]|nr:hypothetical protein C8R43DRAFT_951531 [Mycena crocata]
MFIRASLQSSSAAAARETERDRRRSHRPESIRGPQTTRIEAQVGVKASGVERRVVELTCTELQCRGRDKGVALHGSRQAKRTTVDTVVLLGRRSTREYEPPWSLKNKIRTNGACTTQDLDMRS